MAVNIGLRTGITMKFGQGSFHRESNLPGKAVCGKEMSLPTIRQAEPADWYRRCPKCFSDPDRITRLFFGWE